MSDIHPLRAYRDRGQLTQRQLADLLGVGRETVARWETGIRKIDKQRLPLVAKKTGISPSQLRPDLAEVMREST